MPDVCGTLLNTGTRLESRAEDGLVGVLGGEALYHANFGAYAYDTACFGIRNHTLNVLGRAVRVRCLHDVHCTFGMHYDVDIGMQCARLLNLLHGEACVD